MFVQGNKKLQNVCHILGIVLWRMREMQVNVIQTLHYYGPNVELNKQLVSVVKRCRNVMVPISCMSVMLQMVLGYSFCPLSCLGHLESLCCYGYCFIIVRNIFSNFFPKIYCGHFSDFFESPLTVDLWTFNVVNHPWLCCHFCLVTTSS